MSCTNCFNGCAETVSDQCIRYTGNDVPALGIQHGDTLLSVENAITTFLSSTLTGVGIKPIIDNNIICDLVKNNLPSCTNCTGFTLNDILSALIKSACDLQEQIDTINTSITSINNTLTVLNADYTLPADCLSGVTASSDTHAIVQATINKLCQLNTNLPNTYVPINATPGHPGINDYIESYLNGIPGQSLISDKMIPYVAVPYFNPDLSHFSVSGAGTGDWLNVNLCNGLNFTPDLRGRVLVGTTSGMGGGSFNSNVDPAISGNPTYNLNSLYGTNTVTLVPSQIPAHTHGATSVDSGHVHTTFADVKYNSPGANLKLDTGVAIAAGSNITSTGFANITTSILPNTPAGGSHNNVQPTHACYYIMYIPV